MLGHTELLWLHYVFLSQNKYFNRDIFLLSILYTLYMKKNIFIIIQGVHTKYNTKACFPTKSKTKICLCFIFYSRPYTTMKTFIQTELWCRPYTTMKTFIQTELWCRGTINNSIGPISISLFKISNRVVKPNENPINYQTQIAN